MADDEAPHGGHYVYCTESGARDHNGTPLFYNKGEAWPASDPFVARNPGLFSPEPPVTRTSPGSKADKPERVERATRRPGERRG
jgi:hypothetical protein